MAQQRKSRQARGSGGYVGVGGDGLEPTWILGHGDIQILGGPVGTVGYLDIAGHAANHGMNNVAVDAQLQTANQNRKKEGKGDRGRRNGTSTSIAAQVSPGHAGS